MDIYQDFLALSRQWEGVYTHFYLDHKGFVTIGVGHLVDPIERFPAVMQWPWKFRNDLLRTVRSEDVLDDWRRVQRCKFLAKDGANRAGLVTDLCLHESFVIEQTRKTFDVFVRHLKVHFPHWDQWPWQAQLATVLLAWAVGTNLPEVYPKFSAAARRNEWAICAIECRIDPTKTLGVDKRNAKMKALFEQVR